MSAVSPGSRVSPVRSGRGATAVLALPLVLLALVLGLSALDLNGSSVGVLTAGPDDPSLVAGTPLGIRSDEYGISTPQQVANARRGNPSQHEVGLTVTDLDATSMGTAVSSWTEAFRPFSWPYRLPDVSRAFALHWWTGLAAGVLGLYWLLLVLHVRVGVAVVTSLTVGLAPVVAWWQAAMPGGIVGLLSAAAAALLVARRSPTGARAVGWSLLAAWFLVAAFLVLYPPWFISVGLVVAALVVGQVVAEPAGARRDALVIGVVVVAAAVVVAAWAWQSRDALAALAGTEYPGDRRAEAGDGSLAFLVSAPLNLLLSQGPVLSRGDGVNLSEVSAPWLVLPALAAVLVAGAAALRVRGRSALRRHAPVVAVTAAGAVLTLWTLVPLPSPLGRLLLLDRVPGSRTALAIGVAAALVAALVAGRLPARRGTSAALWAGVVAMAALAAWSAATLLRPEVRDVGVVTGLVVGAAAAALWVLVLRRPDRTPALVALGIVVVASYVVVNPLYRGLGPLESGPVYDAVQRASAHGDRWVVTAGANRWMPTVSSTPGVTLSGLAYYPDPSVWERLAPAQRDVWDNFMVYRWVHDSDATPVRLDRFGLAETRMRVDLCSPQLDFLRIDHVLSAADESRPACFTVTDTVRAGDEDYVILTRSR